MAVDTHWGAPIIGMSLMSDMCSGVDAQSAAAFRSGLYVGLRGEHNARTYPSYVQILWFARSIQADADVIV